MPLLPLAGFLGLGGPEVIIILAVMLLMFGGSKLPELAKGLGKSIKEFKRATQETDEPAPPAAVTAPTPPAAAVHVQPAGAAPVPSTTPTAAPASR